MRRIIYALSFVLLCGFSAQAQEATLSGLITDQTGAVVPQASLELRNEATGFKYKIDSNSEGLYEFSLVKPGPYKVIIEKTGFKTLTRTGIKLDVAQNARIDFSLEIGSTTQMVEVTGAAPMVESTTASVGTLIGNQQTLDLPLNLRRFGALATLVPGTVPDNGGGASSLYSTAFSEQTFVTGGNRDDSNMSLIDGVEAKNWIGGGFSIQPPPDAVEEFKLQTNFYTAVYGISAGSIINLITKSGTNQLHGTVYEFLRNSDMDARNFFALNQTNPVTGAEIPGSARPEYRRNQFGFAVGGPIKKDKTFWFVNYEGLRQIQGLTLTGLMPTNAQKHGDFNSLLTGQTINLCGAGGPANLNFDSGQLFNPTTESLYTCPSGSANAGGAILVGQPIPGNIITTIDPVAQKMVQYFAEPNSPGYPNFVNQQPQDRSDNQFEVRIDHTFGPKDQFYGRYLFGQSNILAPNLGNIEPGFGDTVYFRAQNLALGWTHTFGPTLLNEARFGLQRQNDVVDCQHCPYPQGTVAGFGVRDLGAISPGFEQIPNATFVNFAGIGDPTYTPSFEPDTSEKYQDNLTWTHAKQTVVVGTNMIFMDAFRYGAIGQPAGEFDFDGRFSSLAGEIPNVSGVSDLADFLLGYPLDALRDYHSFLFPNTEGIGLLNFYGQDDIRVTRNLTLNVGLRWEYHRPYVDKWNNLGTPVFTGPPFSGPGNAPIVVAGPDSVVDSFCSNPQYAQYLILPDGRCELANSALRRKLGFTGRAQRSLNFPYWRDYAPRLGIAWRPTHSDKLVVRTGYGIFYDLNMYNSVYGEFNPAFNPFQQYYTAFGDPPPLTNGAPTDTANSFIGPATTIAGAGLVYIQPNRQPTRVQAGSFGIQSQLAQNWALEVNYIGNYVQHQDHVEGSYNQPNPGVGPLQPRRPYPDLTTFFFDAKDADSNYSSLQAKLTKRFSSGITFLTSYTWGHNLDDTDGTQNYSPTQDQNNFKADYGNTYVDARQRLVFSYVWELPVGSGRRFLNRRGAGNAILGGWKLSGIASFQSGFPFSVRSSQDFSNTGSGNPRPDRTCNGTGQKRVNDWFNANCFTSSTLQEALAAGQPRFGDSGRNILTGPGIVNWDSGFLKEFPLGERFKLQFRGEFYNLTNTASFGAPNAVVGSPFIGQISSAGSPRDIQLALKLSF